MMVSDVAPAEGGAVTGGTDVILVMLVKEALEAKRSSYGHWRNLLCFSIRTLSICPCISKDNTDILLVPFFYRSGKR